MTEEKLKELLAKNEIPYEFFLSAKDNADFYDEGEDWFLLVFPYTLETSYALLKSTNGKWSISAIKAIKRMLKQANEEGFAVFTTIEDNHEEMYNFLSKLGSYIDKKTNKAIWMPDYIKTEW